MTYSNSSFRRLLITLDVSEMNSTKYSIASALVIVDKFKIRTRNDNDFTLSADEVDALQVCRQFNF